MATRIGHASSRYAEDALQHRLHYGERFLRGGTGVATRTGLVYLNCTSQSRSEHHQLRVVIGSSENGHVVATRICLFT